MLASKEENSYQGLAHPIGSAMHELLHACGMYHEHSHPDRDKYLFVQNNSYDYRRYEPNDVRCFGNYDFKSIMHYPLGSCMKLKSEVKRDFEIGQREMLSEGDIKAINMLYLDSTPDIQRVKITASNEEMKLQFLLKIKSKIFRRKRSQ
ncbi:uncharacterized protein OCT59_022946 [Rhizophagus irregularis]|uniref:uncharacterized protein n=1 Tax=Rhizophagus irregularis TaxID=588596 RepID=UPI00331F4974|nr:hypothetical protein OCT59_022946 [Rhizophagus irregularis]